MSHARRILDLYEVLILAILITFFQQHMLQRFPRQFRQSEEAAFTEQCAAFREHCGIEKVFQKEGNGLMYDSLENVTRHEGSIFNIGEWLVRQEKQLKSASN